MNLPKPRAGVSPGIKTRCDCCGGPLTHPASIELGLDGACQDQLSNPRRALALAEMLLALLPPEPAGDAVNTSKVSIEATAGVVRRALAVLRAVGRVR